MASLILSTAGAALFGPIGGAIGATIGGYIDQAMISSLTPARVQPSRLSTLKVQGSGEGAPIPIVFGRARVTGQILWVTQFKEHTTKRTVGGKGGQRVIERSYSISFAVGLCEGPIRGLGRIWVNGEAFDLSQVNYRLYRGGEDQMPDPLIEAVEGLHMAPAFRGLAYMVFEDFGLTAYNDRIPNISVEVMTSAPVDDGSPRLEDLARAVCLIPGAGEFTYATTPIQTIWRSGMGSTENCHVQSTRTDLSVSLDQLTRDLPQVDHVSLVVSWFGTDLRAGQCRIEPRVDQRFKPTRARDWRVAGLGRNQANLVSIADGRPAYGGSPDDASVIEAINELKARGHHVTLNPFVMMDIPAGNNLPNPYAGVAGGLGQGAYPWRGRITCYPGPNQSQTSDNTSAAATQIAAFFGAAQVSHFRLRGQEPLYSGPNEWSYRRFILHQAFLAKAAGGVEGFLIGSELLGLTRVRGQTGQFPAVAALQTLAADVRAILGPNVKIGYAADWTEYGAYSPPGTQDLRFPLDPLWADPAIDFIGLDWYAPLTDRRAGEPKPDRDTLSAGIEGGEAYDFYYANEAARTRQDRTPITDGAYQEPWVWRAKDMRNFWANPHYERFNGKRATTPTAWVAQSKPIRLMELGFPAVDKAANRPSVFPDAKSSEAGLPPFSTGQRDDSEQRSALEASLAYWQKNVPLSKLDRRPMIDPQHIFLWAWDARPFPHFPQLQAVWGDGGNAATGHWLAGRAGTLPIRDILSGIAEQAGLRWLNANEVTGFVEGFVIEAPATARALIESVLSPLGLEVQPRFDGLKLVDTPSPVPLLSLASSDFQLKDGTPDVSRTLREQDAPAAIQLTTYASEQEYESATYRADRVGAFGPRVAVTVPLVVDGHSRKVMADQMAIVTSVERLQGRLGPSRAATLQVGDRFLWEDSMVWRVDRLEGPWAQDLVATIAPQGRLVALASHAVEAMPRMPIIAAPPYLLVFDLPAPFTQTQSPKPLVGAFVSPWLGGLEVRIGDQIVARLTRPMTFGNLTTALSPAPISRRLGQACLVKFADGQTPPASGKAAFLGPDRVIDIVTWTHVTWISEQTWQLEGLVRGYHGEPVAPVIPEGSDCVVLDDALVSVDLDPSLIGVRLVWRASLEGETSVEGQTEAGFYAQAARPWSPCHIRAKRTAAGIQITWIRRANGDGDSWAVAQVPMAPPVERYCLTVLKETGEELRTYEVSNPSLLYPVAAESSDFGAAQSQITVKIYQIGASGQPGFAIQERVSVQPN